MATAPGGDLVVKTLSELRELQQQFVASGERVQEQLVMLAQVFRDGQERAQGHFTRLIEMVTQLADDRQRMLRRLDEHDARLEALERKL